MTKLIVESSDPNDTPEDIEEKLQKAADSIRLKRESGMVFEDPYLQEQKTQADHIVTTAVDAMIEDIIHLIGG